MVSANYTVIDKLFIPAISEIRAILRRGNDLICYLLTVPEKCLAHLLY